MPKFLNHLNLNGNQLKNAKLEITDSPTQAKGIIHYHDSSNSVRVYTGTGNSDFFTLGDNDVATSSSAGIVELFSDTVQSTAANSVSSTSNRTYGIQLNGDGQMVVNVPWTDSSALTQEEVEDFAAGLITGATHTGLTATYSDGSGTLALAVDGVLEDLDTLGAAGSDGQVIVATGAGVFQYESGSTLRSTINVDVAGTDNSTDVTLATVSNNYLSISGQAITAGTVPVSLGGTGAVTASAARTALDVDQAGTDNSTNVTLANTNYLSLSGQEITGGTVPITSGGTGAVTAGAARTALNVDVAGTDNSTNVTLATVSSNYLSISGQAITAGNVPISLGGTGQATAAAAADALLNVSQGGSLTIGNSSDTITIAGNLTVEGTQTTIDSTTVSTGDNMLELAKDNTGNATDFGWYGKFVDSGTKYAGMQWDASDTRFRLGYGNDVPGGTIDWDTAGHLEVGKLTTTDLVIGGHTISDVDITSEDSNADDHLMTSAAIRAAIADNNPGFLTAHPSISQATSNVSNSGRTYIQSIGLDSNGHVTSVSTATETVTNTDTIDMGDGFVVAADTNTATTTITENDTLTISGGTNISTVSNPDGTITINNGVTDNNQLANGSNFITSSANITGTSAGITAGNVGAVKVVELTHGAGGVTNENTSNSTDSAVWTITHGMGSSRFYKVEVVQDSGNYDTVYVDVTRPSNATIVVTFGSDVANGAYRAMITRMA
tara:strand:+ start:41 stop:2209 length:2169 start_codon:yes stop_codon:yes gene_type:complete